MKQKYKYIILIIITSYLFFKLGMRSQKNSTKNRREIEFKTGYDFGKKSTIDSILFYKLDTIK